MTRSLLLLFSLLCPVSVWAQDCALPKQASSSAGLIAQYNDLGCFGGERDDSDITRRSQAALKEIQGQVVTAGDYADIRTRAAKALKDLAGSLKDQHASASGQWAQRLQTTQDRMALAAAETALPEGLLRASDWQVVDLAFLDGDMDLSAPLTQDCAKGYTAACQQAQLTSASLLRHANLAHAVLAQLVRVVRVDTKYAELKILDDKWDYYWEHGRSQYPWELMVNKRRFDRDHPDPNTFAEPPSSQIILLHLDAAVEYAKPRDGDGSQFNAVALVEVVGYNWLKYASDGSSGHSYGGSIIATVSPESGGTRIGWGAMVHFTDTWSLGVARRDVGRGEDDTTWLLSADLAKFLDMTSLQEKVGFRTPAAAAATAPR